MNDTERDLSKGAGGKPESPGAAGKAEPVDRTASRARTASLDKTARLDDMQELPPDLAASAATEEEPIQQPFPQAGGSAAGGDVRELAPDKDLQEQAKKQAEARKKQQSWPVRHKKALLLGVGFLIAVFIGFALAGYRQDQADLQNNEHQHQEQQMQERAQKLDAQETCRNSARLSRPRRRRSKRNSAVSSASRAALKGAVRPCRTAPMVNRVSRSSSTR